MNWLAALARMRVPALFKRRALRELFGLTARAFQVEAPALDGLSYSEILTTYARFTAAQAGRALESGSGAEAARQRLFGLARGYGAGLRRRFGIKSRADALSLARLVYGLIGIELSAGEEGALCMTSCFFKEYYSPEVCKLMAALDEGVLTTLFDCRELEFSRRLTEGHPHCLARLL